MTARWAAVAAAGVLSWACSIERPDLTGKRFRCAEDADCPDGQECRAQLCQAISGGDPGARATCSSSDECGDLDCFDSICWGGPAMPPAEWGNQLTFTFDGARGAETRVFRDRSGHARDGSSEQPIALGPGRHGLALALDEGSSFSVADRPEFLFTQGLTVELWVNPSESDSGLIIGDRDPNDDTPPVFSVEIDSGGDIIFVTNTGCSARTEIDFAGPELPLSAWTHVAFVRDAQEIRLYLNGTLDRDFGFDEPPCDHDARIRVGAVGDEPAILGRVDDIKVSDRAKTAQEIAASAAYDSSLALNLCGDRIRDAEEECDTELCCDPNSCALFEDGAACAGSGVCSAGACLVDGGRVDEGLDALYELDEGDGSAVTDSVGDSHLQIASPADAEWDERGLRVTGDTVIAGGPLSALRDRCLARGELSFEVWATPDVEGGAGLAAIASIGASQETLLIAEELDRVVATARTSGGFPHLQSSAEMADASATHVVLVQRADGQRFLYVDGRRQSFNATSGSLLWPADAILHLANDASMTRPWRGLLHRAAVYCRALDAYDVGQNFAAGPR